MYTTTDAILFDSSKSLSRELFYTGLENTIGREFARFEHQSTSATRRGFLEFNGFHGRVADRAVAVVSSKISDKYIDEAYE